jgi:NAD(P)H-dependent flavin oxidoreductase YrpB (nitropropane dioxygenase family)
MGTRFMATKEAPIHDSIKQELVKASERDTALIMRTFRNTARIFKVVFRVHRWRVNFRTRLLLRSSKSKRPPKRQISRKSSRW